jgi:hypothetical protein
MSANKPVLIRGIHLKSGSLNFLSLSRASDTKVSAFEVGNKYHESRHSVIKYASR